MRSLCITLWPETAGLPFATKKDAGASRRTYGAILKMKKIGFMGCGVIASSGHLPAILETPGLELTAVYDPNPVQVARFRERYPHASGFTDVARISP